MPSKLVLAHENDARSVSEAIHTYAAQVASALEPRLRPLLKRGESLPDVALMLQLLARLTVADSDTLVAADDANEAELADDVPLRASRDETIEQLYRIIVDLRDAVVPAFGPAGLAAFKLTEPATKEPKALARLATAVAQALRSDVALKPRHPGLKIDRHAFADQIAPLAESLAASVSGLERETKENTQALLAKTTAFEAAERSIGGASGVTIALLETAQLEKLAERVLPVLRQRSSTPGVPPTGDTPGT